MDQLATCQWDGGWAGRCKELAVGGEFCSKHQGQRCVSCGQQAVRECAQTGIQFVCGAPLCATCQHGIPEPGNAGWFMLGGGHVTQEVYQQQLSKGK